MSDGGTRQRTTVRWAGAALLVAVLVAAFPATGWLGLRDRRGSALAARGPQEQATIGLRDVRVGDQLLYALPAFDNRTSDALTIESVRVIHVPAGLEVLGYRSLTFAQTDGMMLAWHDRTSDMPFAPLALSLRGLRGLVVPARSVGKRYALVHVRVTTRPAGRLEDVEVVYRRRGAVYHQRMHGRWAVEMEGEPPPPSQILEPTTSADPPHRTR
jgi:hypothetical protein